MMNGTSKSLRSSLELSPSTLTTVVPPPPHSSKSGTGTINTSLSQPRRPTSSTPNSQTGALRHFFSKIDEALEEDDDSSKAVSSNNKQRQAHQLTPQAIRT